MTPAPAPPRILPLDPPYSDAVETSLSAMMGRSPDIPPLALFRTLLRNFEAGDRIRPLGSYLLAKGTIEPRERELVIHRVTARCRAEYEWGVHATIFGQALGLSDQWLDATFLAEADDPLWSDRERLLIAFVDGLHETASVGDEPWEAMRPHWSDEQLLELLLLAGWYHLISFVANGARVRLEPWARRFPIAAA